MAIGGRKSRESIKGSNLMPMGMGEAELERIKEMNWFIVAQTKVLFDGILHMSAVQNRLAAQEVQGLLNQIERFIDPWVEDITRGCVKTTITGNAVSSNISIA